MDKVTNPPLMAVELIMEIIEFASGHKHTALILRLVCKEVNRWVMPGSAPSMYRSPPWTSKL